ncbi:toxin [Salmonella enterica]|uniref:Cytolethal distending toxin subunit A n=1 Tax=Salmonella enterica TaxID=28901 RepID=A0A628V6T2_SALER|nr:toxin [Salmonella enterica]
MLTTGVVMEKLHVCFIFIFLLTGCSSSPTYSPASESDKTFPVYTGKGPVPPDREEPGLVIPGPGPAMSSSEGLGSAPLPSSGSMPTVTLMSVSGAVVSAWSRRPNSWLWGYIPGDSNTFGNLRNWKIQPGKTPGSVRFVNEVLGTCITPGFSLKGDHGFIHRFCSYRSNDQDFRLLPALNGNVFIQSVLVKKCMRARFLDRTTRSPYAFDVLQADCPSPGVKTLEMLWSVSEPLKPALASISKPVLRPAAALPIEDDDAPELSAGDSVNLSGNQGI